MLPAPYLPKAGTTLTEGQVSEMAGINTSLLALAAVVMALQTPGRKHVPYR